MIFKPGTGFASFQLHSRYEKAEPVPGSFHASILSPRRLTSLANVGLSRVQLVPSCENGKRNTYYKYKTFKSTTRTLQIILFFKLWINTRLSRAQLVPSCKYGKRQHILQKQDFQEDNSYRIVLSYRYCYLTTWSL